MDAAAKRAAAEAAAGIMVVSRCRGIGPPSRIPSSGHYFLLAADLRRHPSLAALGLAES